MIAFLPLIATISAATVISSPSEKRTLQTAITGTLTLSELSRFHQLCRDLQLGTAVGSIDFSTLAAEKKFHLLLQQKLHTTDVVGLADTKFLQQIKHDIKPLSNCDDKMAFQSMWDKFELTSFALEISPALPRSVKLGATPAQRANAEIARVIARSNAIALVSISDRQQLSAVQQANYLHLDYQSRYIFKVEHGWRNVVPGYLGMHIHVDEESISRTPKQWLVFLDQKNHFIKAVAADSAAAYIKQLNKPEWQFDQRGNLHRTAP